MLRYFLSFTSFKLILLLFTTALVLGCESETIKVDNSIKGKEYYPVATGKKWVYEYDSTVYDKSSNRILNSSGFILEEIGEKVDEERFKISRSWKRNEGDQWQLTDLWTTRLENTRAIKTEENLAFIKLVFPPNKDAAWNGNALFKDNTEIVVEGEAIQPYLGWKYFIEKIDDTYSNRDLQFEDVILVNQVDTETSLDRRVSIEKFAPGIGLVEKYMMILDCQCFSVSKSIPWEEKAEKGFILSQKLISYE